MRSDCVQPVRQESIEYPDLIQLCDYVDRSFEDLVSQFEAPEAQALFERALEKVTGLPAEVHRIQSAVVSRHVARFPMAWRAGDFEGEATLTTIVLHAGSHPITELLVRVEVPGAAASLGFDEDRTARMLREFLEVVTTELAMAK